MKNKQHMLIAGMALLCLFSCKTATQKPVDMNTGLLDQLNGKSCQFQYGFKGEKQACYQREIGIEEQWFGIEPVRHMDHQCIIWAAQCLAATKNTKAVPSLLNLLYTKSNMQTCDGVIPLRSEIIKALGTIGDKRAIAPLRHYLDTVPMERMTHPQSAKAMSKYGCKPQPEPKEPAREALKNILEART